jgi:D-alanine-D-alanine ligase
MSQKNIVVLFGGQSSEHEVSCVSATTIIENIDERFYKVFPVGITKEGKWFLFEGELSQLKSGKWIQYGKPAIISPDATKKCLVVMGEDGIKEINIDVVFPALHGLFGEDGTVQGLLEMAQIPYVGCGVLASSIAMDKLYTKIIVDQLGIRQAKYVSFLKTELNQIEGVVSDIEKALDYPVFVKPSNAGSSVGITKAHNQEELIKGLKEAMLYDRKILVEEAIVGREIECAVLGGNTPKASGVGEILAAAEFYDYDAKYNNEASKTVLSPDLPEGIEKEVRDAAVKIFKAIDGYGLSRVDFFVENGTHEIVFNEINTLPGFTAISMYPMLWEDKGISKSQLVDKLIQLAFNRYQ